MSSYRDTPDLVDRRAASGWDRTGEDLQVLGEGSLRGSGPDTHTMR